MKDRIKKIIESQNMTQQEFAENIKVAPATLSSIFTGRTAPSLKIVEAIKSRFPDISTDWLLFGRGAMTDYKSEEAASLFGGSQVETMYTDLDKNDDGNRRAIKQNLSTDSSCGDNIKGLKEVAIEQKNDDNKLETTKRQIVKNCDKDERRIVEIRLFYNDQTWETFVPKK